MAVSMRSRFENDRRSVPMERLTAKEREVLALMAEGDSNEQIAARLEVTARTVESHTSRIFQQARSRSGPDDPPPRPRRARPHRGQYSAGVTLRSVLGRTANRNARINAGTRDDPSPGAVLGASPTDRRSQ